MWPGNCELCLILLRNYKCVIFIVFPSKGDASQCIFVHCGKIRNWLPCTSGWAHLTCRRQWKGGTQEQAVPASVRGPAVLLLRAVSFAKKVRSLYRCMAI